MKHLKSINENINNSERVLFVKSNDGDYGALMFEDEYSGTSVSTIMDNLSNYEGEDWIIEVFEFGSIDRDFVKFIRDNIQDYDASKHENFYLEGDVIK